MILLIRTTIIKIIKNKFVRNFNLWYFKPHKNTKKHKNCPILQYLLQEIHELHLKQFLKLLCTKYF